MTSGASPEATQYNTVTFSIDDSRTVASIVLISVIILATSSAVCVEKYWNKRLRDIFTRKRTSRPSISFRLKRWILLAFLITINIGAIVIIYIFGNQQATIAIIILAKAKDILCAAMLPIYYGYKICTRYNAKRPLLNGDGKTIVSIIPVYKETLEEIIYTMDSIINNSTKMYQMLVVIICDGHIPQVDTLVDKKEAVESNLHYCSWKGAKVGCEVIYGYRKATPLVIIRKDKNMEKRDSLILAYDVFNQPRHNATQSCINFRTSIIEKIKMVFCIHNYHYIFFTDADSFIKAGSLTNLIDELEYRNVTAACGLVMVDFSGRFGGFWNIYQNFQYIYGQYVRRNAENIIARLTCLPGCITMVKVDSRIAGVISDYAKMPAETDLILTTVQRLGTDRRLTHLYNVHQLKTCMVDSAVCYTQPPQNWYRLLAQRRRWGSNAFFNSSMNFWSMKVHPIVRISALFDLFKMSLVAFRLFNIGLFIYALTVRFEVKSFFIQSSYVSYPSFYFFFFSMFKKRIRVIMHKMLIGFIINTLLSGLISVGVMATVFYNIGNFSWGPSTNVPLIVGESSTIYVIPTTQVSKSELPVTIVVMGNNTVSHR